MSDFFASYNAVIVLMGINVVFAYSMYAVLIAGQLSLAQAGFASIAGYTSALLTIELGWPFPLVLAAGLLVGAVAAFIVGLPVLRLRGVFLAIATLGFGEVIRIVANNISITGGAQGLRGIPKVVGMPHVWIAAALAAWFFARLRATRLGLGFAAVREDEIAAETSGIDVVRYKMYAFVISGAVAGVTGVLFAHFTRFISPGQFGFTRALDALLYAIVGGTGLWIGPLLGAGFLTLLPEVQRQFGFEQAWIRPAISGGVLLLVILFLPEGLAGIGRVARRLTGRGRPGATPVVGSGGLSTGDDTAPADEQPAAGDPDQGTASAPPADSAESDAPTGDAGTASAPAPTADAPLLVRATGLDKDYGGVKALDGVDLEIRAGEIVGLIGPNGAGKTTLVNVLTGLTPATDGTIEVAGTPVESGTRANRVAALGVARTFQQVRLFDHLSVRENVLIGAHLASRSTFGRRLVMSPSARRDEAAARAQADDVLTLAGLGGRGDAPASALSYGDRRRLEIARALAAQPRLLVLDEPAAGMNHVEASRLGSLIRSIAGRGVTVLLIEHNVRLVMRTCTRVVVLDFGQKIADGDPQTVADDPQVVAAYLGGDEDEGAA